MAIKIRPNKPPEPSNAPPPNPILVPSSTAQVGYELPKRGRGRPKKQKPSDVMGVIEKLDLGRSAKIHKDTKGKLERRAGRTIESAIMSTAKKTAKDGGAEFPTYGAEPDLSPGQDGADADNTEIDDSEFSLLGAAVELNEIGQEISPDKPALDYAPPTTQQKPSSVGGRIAYQPIFAMGEIRVKQINDLLTQGDSVDKVTDLIQQEWKLCLHMERETLRRMLFRYRTKVIHKGMIEAIAQASAGKSIKTLRSQVNAMLEMQELAMIQKTRVDNALRYEAQMKGLPQKIARDEISCLNSILRDLASVQLDVGVLKRAPKMVAGQSMDSDGKLTTFSWTEEDQELLTSVNQTLELTCVRIDDDKPRLP